MGRFLIILMMMATITLYSADLTSDKNINADKKTRIERTKPDIQSGIDIYLARFLNKDISVTINGLDTTIFGKLKTISNDSIMIENILGQEILIPKRSIAYIKNIPEKKVK